MYNLTLYLPIVDNRVTITRKDKKGKVQHVGILYLEPIQGQKEKMRVTRGKYESRWVNIMSNPNDKSKSYLVISYRDFAHALGCRVNSKKLRLAFEQMIKEDESVINLVALIKGKEPV